jgi:hypothetical protein
MGAMAGKYGVYRMRHGEHRTTHKASHVAYALTYGPLPAEKFACHNCPGGDNPRCCNPRHLFAGTHQENMADAVQKGQTCAGERNPSAKLTVLAIRDIRARRGIGSQQSLADEYGVSQNLISKIQRREIWKFLSD